MPRLLIRRAGAYVLDVVLLFLVLFPVGQLLHFAMGWQPPSSPWELGVWLASVLNFSVPTWTYFVLSDSSTRGATVGKSLLGLRVTRVKDVSVSRARAVWDAPPQNYCRGKQRIYQLSPFPRSRGFPSILPS